MVRHPSLTLEIAVPRTRNPANAPGTNTGGAVRSADSKKLLASSRRFAPYGEATLPPPTAGLSDAMEGMGLLSSGPISSRTRGASRRGFPKPKESLPTLKGPAQASLPSTSRAAPVAPGASFKPKLPANVSAAASAASRRPRVRSQGELPWHVEQNVLDLLDSFIRLQRETSAYSDWKPLRAPPKERRPPATADASALPPCTTTADGANHAAALPAVRTTHGGRPLSEVRSSARLSTSLGGLGKAVVAHNRLFEAGTASTSRPITASSALAPLGVEQASSFEAVLRLYYRHALPTEIDAMLRVAVPALEAARAKAWVDDLKARCHEQVCRPHARPRPAAPRRLDPGPAPPRRLLPPCCCPGRTFMGVAVSLSARVGRVQVRQAFFMGDSNGDGGLSIAEFAAAVALHNGRGGHAAAGAGADGGAEGGAEGALLEEGGGDEERAAAMDRQAAAAHPALAALFAAGDKDGNGLLDEEEFYELVSRSAELRESFRHILALGCAKRARAVERQHALVFHGPYSPQSHSVISPSGRRRRPNLTNLRKVQAVELGEQARKARDRGEGSHAANGLTSADYEPSATLSQRDAGAVLFAGRLRPRARQ